jgi:hypothetical protein
VLTYIKDVLCGRGRGRSSGSSSHPGNSWFLTLIRGNSSLYQNCRKSTKLLVVKQIVAAVTQQRSPPGRFIKLIGDGTVVGWTHIPYEQALRRTSQALRDSSASQALRDSSYQLTAHTSIIETTLDALIHGMNRQHNNSNNNNNKQAQITDNQASNKTSQALREKDASYPLTNSTTIIMDNRMDDKSTMETFSKDTLINGTNRQHNMNNNKQATGNVARWVKATTQSSISRRELKQQQQLDRTTNFQGGGQKRSIWCMDSSLNDDGNGNGDNSRSFTSTSRNIVTPLFASLIVEEDVDKTFHTLHALRDPSQHQEVPPTRLAAAAVFESPWNNNNSTGNPTSAATATNNISGINATASGRKSTAQPRPLLNVSPHGIGPISDPNENGILCGGGNRRINIHTGNVQFEVIVHSKKIEYKPPSTKNIEKVHIAADIVNDVRTSQVYSKTYTFPYKLYDLITNSTSTGDAASQDVVSWSFTGIGFIIHDRKRFASELLPKYFGHNKIRSFVRQIQYWSFVRLPFNTNASWKHPSFKKGRRDLLKHIIRKKITTAAMETEEGEEKEDDEAYTRTQGMHACPRKCLDDSVVTNELDERGSRTIRSSNKIDSHPRPLEDQRPIHVPTIMRSINDINEVPALEVPLAETDVVDEEKEQQDENEDSDYQHEENMTIINSNNGDDNLYRPVQEGDHHDDDDDDDDNSVHVYDSGRWRDLVEEHYDSDDDCLVF